MVKLVMEHHHRSLKIEEFILELHHWNCEEVEASIEASSHRLPHPCEPLNSQFSQERLVSSKVR